VLGREILGGLRHYPPLVREFTAAVGVSEFLGGRKISDCKNIFRN
jgi:hypothetical protein